MILPYKLSLNFPSVRPTLYRPQEGAQRMVTKQGPTLQGKSLPYFSRGKKKPWSSNYYY